MAVNVQETPSRIASWRERHLALISRVDPDTHAEVKARARASGMSMSDWVAAAVRQALRS